MQITVGANCWDGKRRKSLVDAIKLEVFESKPRFMDALKLGAKRLNDPKVKTILGYVVPLALLFSGLPPFGLMRAFANSASLVPAEAVPVLSTAVQTKILHAFDPLIHMIQSLAYPIAGVMIAGGCLFIMVGHRERGMQMLQNAAIGYILVQISPMILELLVGVGSTVM